MGIICTGRNFSGGGQRNSGTVYLFPNSNSGGAAEINEQKGADQFKGVF